MSFSSFLPDLYARNLVQDLMPGLQEQLAREMTRGYIGFDPTADSLHVGNLLPITLLMRLQRAGHKPYVLLGGATGMIGDPSGKSAERNLLDAETIAHNIAAQRAQLERFLSFDEAAPNAAVMVNNYDWFSEYRFLDFIREVGKYITVGYMMAKDSVQKRLETGLSFTEFTYQLIQGYDFFYLHQNHNVLLQMGGSDQWGNMVTGTELIRKKAEGEAFALTCPLVTKADGSKFGKSEQGNVWLDPARTSPYQFYQFWLKLADEDASRMIYSFSFLPVAEIEALIAAHNEAPHKRLVQAALAEEMTTLVHSEADLALAQQASQILFGNASIDVLQQLSESQLLEIMEGVPQVAGSLAALAEGIDLISFLAETAIAPSKGEARKLLQNGGISINKQKVTEAVFTLRSEHLLQARYVLVQKGKSNYTLAIFN